MPLPKVNGYFVPGAIEWYESWTPGLTSDFFTVIGGLALPDGDDVSSLVTFSSSFPFFELADSDVYVSVLKLGLYTIESLNNGHIGISHYRKVSNLRRLKCVRKSRNIWDNKVILLSDCRWQIIIYTTESAALIIISSWIYVFFMHQLHNYRYLKYMMMWLGRIRSGLTQ